MGVGRIKPHKYLLVFVDPGFKKGFFVQINFLGLYNVRL